MCCETDTGDTGDKPVRLSSCLDHELRLTIGTYQQREGQQLLSPDRVPEALLLPLPRLGWLRNSAGVSEQDAVLLSNGARCEMN